MIKKQYRTLIIILVIISLMAPVTVGAENHKSSDRRTKSKNSPADEENESDTPFFESLLVDQGRILTSPFRMKLRDLAVWGGVALLTSIIIHNDEAIYRDIKLTQERNPWIDDVSPALTYLGDGFVNLGISGAFYLGGVIFRDPRAKETARLLMMTFLHTSLVAQIGKHITGRQRPSWENGIDQWHFLDGIPKRWEDGNLSQFDAFPSGHTINAFGTATIIAQMYKDTKWVPILCYSLATLSGLSRVTEDTHWFSDVFMGAVLGYVIGRYIFKTRNRQGKFVIYPLTSASQIGLGLKYTF